MNAYLASILKKHTAHKKNQETTYLPHTQSLSEQINIWLLTLNDTSRSQLFYEVDLCRLFNCRKEDLAIAMSLLNINGIKRNLNGIPVRAYSLVANQAISELNECQQFIYQCLNRGYITTQSEGWPTSMPCRTLYECFMHSELFQSCSDRAFGRDILQSGIVRKRRSSRTVNVWNYDLRPLIEARKIFSEAVLLDKDYNWE